LSSRHGHFGFAQHIEAIHFTSPHLKANLIMKISILGAGNMGLAFAKQLSAAGHQVRITARDLGKARAAVSNLGNIEVVAASEVAHGADLIIVATGYADAVTALQSAGDLSGKTIVDITNPVTPDYMALTLGHSTSAAEEIARAFPKAHVVKAFNTLFAQVLAQGADFGAGNKVSVFYAGDDAAAKTAVHTLAESMGFKAVDAGGLKNARYLEPLAGLNIYLGYGAGMGTSIAPVWIERA
jgi:8-hydroxy-5-deazaflavin:NADPH oxidoreductase